MLSTTTTTTSNHHCRLSIVYLPLSICYASALVIETFHRAPHLFDGDVNIINLSSSRRRDRNEIISLCLVTSRELEDVREHDRRVTEEAERAQRDVSISRLSSVRSLCTSPIHF